MVATKGHKPTNTKPNTGSFKKGSIPWNKGKRIDLDINSITNDYFKKEMSTEEIAKKLNVDQKTIENRLKENGYELRSKTRHTQRTKEKISNTMKRKGIKPTEPYFGKPTKGCFKEGRNPWNKGKVGLQKSNKKGKTFEELYGIEKAKEIQSKIKIKRAYQITPLKDTTIEVKIQDFLKQLGIEFLTHQYMKEIEHAYQCDILIPVQKGINQKTIIECFGDYWHNRPYGREVDIDRCNELRKKGWRVLVLWEAEIRPMELINLREMVIR